MGERRSSRPKRDVAYASFAGEDSVDDEDFVIVKAQPKIEKKSISKNKLQEECDLNLKKEQKVKKIQENVFTKKEEPKKRLPLDEKLLMRDIQKAVEISRSQSSLEDGGDDDDDAFNPIKNDATDDTNSIKPSTQQQQNDHHQEHQDHHQELSTPTTNVIADNLSLPPNTSTSPVALPTISSLPTITTTGSAIPVFLATISTNPVPTTTMERTNQIARKQVADKSKTSKKRSHQSDDDDNDDDDDDDYSSDEDSNDDDDYSTSKANNKKKHEVKVQKAKPQNPKVTKKVAKSSAKAPSTTTASPLVTASSSLPLVTVSSSSLPPTIPKAIPSLTPSISQSNKFASSTPRSSMLRLGLSRKSRVTSLHPSK